MVMALELAVLFVGPQEETDKLPLPLPPGGIGHLRAKIGKRKKTKTERFRFHAYVFLKLLDARCR